jgi:hypothetical protein
MRLIKEHIEEVEFLIENSGSGKKYFIEGNFMAYDQRVKNGRTYPKAVMESAVNRYTKDYINQNRAMGELGHPATPSINLDRVSHVIKGLNFNESTKTVIGKAQVIDTPMGITAQKLMEAGVKLGVSSRGLGTIKAIGGESFVQSDFMLNTVDIVADPSGPGCFVEGIMENAEWVQNSTGDWIQLVVDLQKKRISEEVALKEFARLMGSLKG